MLTTDRRIDRIHALGYSDDDAYPEYDVTVCFLDRTCALARMLFHVHRSEFY